MTNKPHSPYDLIIIGAGISGLMALRHALKAKLNVLCLEKASDVGGLWRDLPDWQDLQTRKEDWAINHTPIQSELRKDVHENIKALVRKYFLKNHIRFQTRVENLKWNESYWVITTHQGTFQAKNIIIATGLQNKPQIPTVQKIKSQITEYHSSTLFDPSTLANKRVTIVGGGASAFDCLELALKYKAQKIDWVYRSTKWFVPTWRVKYESADLRGIAYYQMCNVPIERQSKLMHELLLKRYKQAGLEEITPSFPFDYSFHQLVAGRPKFIQNFKNIQRHKGEIKILEEKNVKTEKGNFETDILIWCTGYKMDLTWTGLEAYQNLTSSLEIRKKLGSFFISLDYPNLSFTGASLLDANSTAPFLFSVITRSLISEIKGTCKLPRTPLLPYITHWDIVKFFAKYDRANYFPFFWKIKYFLKAFYYQKFKNKQLSI